MDGTILNFDAGNGAGIIRASDGKRYKFGTSDWASSGSPLVGDIVDFEPVDGQASEIFVTSRVAQAERSAVVIPMKIISSPVQPRLRAETLSVATETSTSTVAALTANAATDTAPIALPSGKGARFFLVYFVAMVPTYILPYFGSNSGVLNTVSAGMGAGLLPGYLWHATFIAILCTLAYVRGVRIQRGWLVAFPIVGGFFDLVPGFNWIPFVPTVMHAVTMYVGASKDAVPGFDRDSVLPKVKWGYWGLTAFSAWTTYKCFTSVYSGNAGSGGIAMAFGPLVVLMISGVIGLRVHKGFTDNFQLAFDSLKSEGLQGITDLMSTDADEASSKIFAKPAATEIVNPPVKKPTDANAGAFFCAECGHANTAEDSFCGECGVAL